MDEVNKLYERLSKNYEVHQITPPTFIECHVDAETEIIIVTKKKGSANGCKTPKKIDSAIQNLDLTGSPLKLDLSYDGLSSTLLNESQNWLKEEDTYEPIPSEEAEDILQQHHFLALRRSDLLPMWVLCNGDNAMKRILLASCSQEGFFNRAVVFNLGLLEYSNLSIDDMKLKHSQVAKCNIDQVSSKVESIFYIAGSRVKPSRYRDAEEILKKPNTGSTQVHCEWEAISLQYCISASIKLVQEVVIGHFLSPCTTLWRSVCSLQGINNALVNISAAGLASGRDWENVSIRPYHLDNEAQSADETLKDRLHHLIGTVEVYGSTWNSSNSNKRPHDNYATLSQMLQAMENTGISRDFTYRLWDIIKDSTSVGEIVSLLIFSITKIAKNSICPYIDPTNTTQIAKMINKISYDPTQAPSVVKYIKSNIIRSLAFIGELGMVKTCKEYTSLLSMVDVTLGYNDKLGLDGRLSKKTREAINQTMHDMTIGASNMSIFDNSMADNAMRFNSSSIFSDTLHDLTIDNTRKPRRRGFLETNNDDDDDLYNPDMVDEEAICKEWKLKLKRMAQLHVCLEHLAQLQQSLSASCHDLIPILSNLMCHYTNEKSSVKSVSQMFNDPVQAFTIPIQRNLVEDRVKNKRASLYKITLSGHSSKYPKEFNHVLTRYICSQRPIFPPAFLNYSGDNLNADDGELKYHTTEYVYLSNPVPASIAV